VIGKVLAALSLLIGAAAVLAAIEYRGIRLEADRAVGLWQEWSNPGLLARAHASLDVRCGSCHTPLLGPDPAKCAACHADDRGLLERQSTAFHADVRSCRECHLEHLGRQHVSRRMDHVALAQIGAQRVPQPEAQGLGLRLMDVLPPLPAAGRADNLLIRPEEASLDCATCHSRRDRHQGQFGTDCAMCHPTTSWRVPGYVHPSAGSTDCAQCHLEPPSHRMMHFEMVSKMVSGQMHADVRQCFLCHQTTSWNDIKGVGWYKHH